MSRSVLLLLLFVVGLVAVLIILASIDAEVETQVIEEPVPNEALEN